MRYRANRRKIFKAAFIVILSVIILLTALSFIKIPFKMYWKSQNIFNSPITKIKLASYPEYFGGWVEFSDDDLIQRWVDYFDEIDIQHNIGLDFSNTCAAVIPKDGVEHDCITLYTESSEITLLFNASQTMRFADSFRSFNITNGEYPFDEIYKTAEERHGLIKN